MSEKGEKKEAPLKDPSTDLLGKRIYYRVPDGGGGYIAGRVVALEGSGDKVKVQLKDGTTVAGISRKETNLTNPGVTGIMETYAAICEAAPVKTVGGKGEEIIRAVRHHLAEKALIIQPTEEAQQRVRDRRRHQKRETGDLHQELIMKHVYVTREPFVFFGQLLAAGTKRHKAVCRLRFADGSELVDLPIGSIGTDQPGRALTRVTTLGDLYRYTAKAENMIRYGEPVVIGDVAGSLIKSLQDDDVTVIEDPSMKASLQWTRRTYAERLASQKR